MEINLVEITDELLFLHLKATVWTHIIFKIKLIVNSYWKMFHEYELECTQIP